MRTRKMLMAWTPCVLWMALIFAMSAMTGEVSGEQSGQIVRLLLTLFPGLGDSAQTLGVIVRKGAHMTEYAVLFLLYRRALKISGARYAGGAAFAMAVCYAATDEFHQLFVSGRGPSPVDVMIDACGALIAWGICTAVTQIRKGRLRD